MKPTLAGAAILSFSYILIASSRFAGYHLAGVQRAVYLSFWIRRIDRRQIQQRSAELKQRALASSMVHRFQPAWPSSVMPWQAGHRSICPPPLPVVEFISTKFAELPALFRAGLPTLMRTNAIGRPNGRCDKDHRMIRNSSGSYEPGAYSRCHWLPSDLKNLH